MESHHYLVAHLSAALISAMLLGLVVHRRERLCRSFFLYGVAVLLGNRLVVTWPETFLTWWFAQAKEIVYSTLVVCTAVEVGVLTFSRLPRARRQVLATACAAAGLLLCLAIMPGQGTVAALLRTRVGIVWLFLCVVGISAYYRVPLHPFHRAILMGFVLYQGAYTVSLALVHELGPSAYSYYAALDPAAYAATAGVWTWAAWRRGVEPTQTGRRLHPWAASSW